MHIEPKLRQRLIAWLARSSRELQPAAAALPSDTELLQLSEGALSADRRREIMAHLARDGELTHRWVQLQQDWKLTKTPATPKPKRPRPPAWTWLLSSATAAVLAVAVIWPYSSRDPLTDLETLNWPSTANVLHWPLGSKALKPAAPDKKLRAALAAGVVTASEQAPADDDWAALTQWYAKQATDCPQQCDEAQNEAWRLGYWATWVRLACLSKEAMSSTDQALLIEARQSLSVPAAIDITDQAQSPQDYCVESAKLFSYFE